MKLRAFGPFILVMAAAAGPARAAPCVSATFDKPLPNAVDVVTRRADVPSPQFPGLWQEGRLDGLFYALFANGEALVRSGRRTSDWQVKVACPTGTADCTITAEGDPPQQARDIADVLGRCLQGVALAPPPPPAPTPEQRPACGLATVPEGTPVAVLQSLLIASGTDPGPVDGILGTQTQDALAQTLGDAASSLTITDAIAALDRLLCDPSQ